MAQPRDNLDFHDPPLGPLQQHRIIVNEFPTVNYPIVLTILTATLMIIYALIGLAILGYVMYRIHAHRCLFHCFVLIKLIYLYVTNGHSLRRRDEPPKDV